MFIVAGIAAYVAAVLCLCALAGASRRKQERCLRARRRKEELVVARAASLPPKDLVALRLRRVRRA